MASCLKTKLKTEQLSARIKSSKVSPGQEAKALHFFIKYATEKIVFLVLVHCFQVQQSLQTVIVTYIENTCGIVAGRFGI